MPTRFRPCIACGKEVRFGYRCGWCNHDQSLCRYEDAFGGPCILPSRHPNAHHDGCSCDILLEVYRPDCPKHGNQPPEPPQVWHKGLMSVDEFVSMTRAWVRYWTHHPHRYVPCKDRDECGQCNDCAGIQSMPVHIQGTL